MHLNGKVLLGLGGVALAVLAIAPQAFGSILPLLILAICPLSMVFMMRGMAGHGQGQRQGHEHGAGCHGDHANGNGHTPANTDDQTDTDDREKRERTP